MLRKHFFPSLALAAVAAGLNPPSAYAQSAAEMAARMDAMQRQMQAMQQELAALRRQAGTQRDPPPMKWSALWYGFEPGGRIDVEEATQA